MVPAQCTNCGETARTFWREAMSLATRTVCDGCGQEVVKRGRSRETVAGIMFVLVMALAIAGAREGLGLRVALSVGAGAEKAPLEIRAPQSSVCVEAHHREGGSAQLRR